MKRRMHLAIIALLSAVLLSSFTAGTPASAVAPQANTQVDVNFGMLGRTDTLMQGPYATLDMPFSLPANWALQQGATLQLLLTSRVATESTATIPDGQYLGATMTVTLDKKVITTLPLTAGAAVPYQISIPATALVSPYDDGHHLLTLFLSAGQDCVRNTVHHTTVIVLANSQFTLPYTEVAPSTDLTLLPRPLYQRNSVFPVAMYLIVPNGPTAQEMQGALTVAAAFGRMTSGNQPVTLLPVGSLTPDILNSSNLVFVGKAPFLATLPAPWSSNIVLSTGIQPDDGLLQLAVSPWNGGHSVLIVSGNSDTGVVKAAQALSNNNVQTGSRTDVAVVADVGQVSAAADQRGAQLPGASSSHTFGDLGYGAITLTGAGISDGFVQFVIPPGTVATTDSYLDLTLVHSPAADLTNSNVTVFVNGTAIGGAILSGQDGSAAYTGGAALPGQSTSATTQRIAIPLSVLLPGSNELRIRANLVPLTLCSSPGYTDLSVSILPESVLNLPLVAAPANVTVVRDLSRYPYPFANQPTLSNLAFVLPQDDAAVWNQAAQVAYGIGHGASGAIFDLAVAYDGKLDDATRQGHDLVVLGLPSKLSLVADAHGSLPAPFAPGSNTAVVNGQIVSYRFPPNISLGYLELFTSPWSADHTVLLISGTDENGLGVASTTLTGSAALQGNLAIINNKDITVIDTRTGLGLADLARGNLAAPSIATPVSPAPGPGAASTGRPLWMLPAIGALLVLIVGVAMIALFQRRTGKRAR